MKDRTFQDGMRDAWRHARRLWHAAWPFVIGMSVAIVLAVVVNESAFSTLVGLLVGLPGGVFTVFRWMDAADKEREKEVRIA